MHLLVHQNAFVGTAKSGDPDLTTTRAEFGASGNHREHIQFSSLQWPSFWRPGAIWGPSVVS